MPKPYVLIRIAITDGKVNTSKVKRFSNLCEIAYWAECHDLELVKDSTVFGGHYRNPRTGTAFEVHLNS
jgi:hypothetical protein